MVKVITRRRGPGETFVRYFVTVEGDTHAEELIKKVELGNYPRKVNGRRIIETQIHDSDEAFHLLGYLKVVHKEQTLPTVQDVMDAIAKTQSDISGEVFAFEFHHGFYDFAATDFYGLEDEGYWVSLVALFTKEETGKALPGTKLSFSRPFGMDDEEWKELKNKYGNSLYGYIEE